LRRATKLRGRTDCCVSSACRAREEGNGTSLGRQSPLHDDVVVVALASHVAVVALPVDLGGKGLSHFHVVKASLSHSETVSASLSHSPWPLSLSLSLCPSAEWRKGNFSLLFCGLEAPASASASSSHFLAFLVSGRQ
jgi:hypothetical protein